MNNTSWSVPRHLIWGQANKEQSSMFSLIWLIQGRRFLYAKMVMLSLKKMLLFLLGMSADTYFCRAPRQAPSNASCKAQDTTIFGFPLATPRQRPHSLHQHSQSPCSGRPVPPFSDFAVYPHYPNTLSCLTCNTANPKTVAYQPQP